MTWNGLGSDADAATNFKIDSSSRSSGPRCQCHAPGAGARLYRAKSRLAAPQSCSDRCDRRGLGRGRAGRDRACQINRCRISLDDRAASGPIGMARPALLRRGVGSLTSQQSSPRRRANIGRHDVTRVLKEMFEFPVKRVGWVERSETHRFGHGKGDGFRKGSTHPTCYAPIASAARRCRVSPARRPRSHARIFRCLSW